MLLEKGFHPITYEHNSENGENERMNVILSGSWILGCFLTRNFYYHIQFLVFTTYTYLPSQHGSDTTVKLGDKERFDNEQIGVKELFNDYQPFYTIKLLLDKELLPI